ncbi:MAG: FxLYD domain-containing protein [Patescibacteria group bacterium]
MTWAGKRRLLVALIGGAVIVAFSAVLIISSIYETPSCVDLTMNQDEVGVDCGGSCPYLCTAQVLPPTTLYSKVVSNGAGRLDLVASVENKNATAAAKNVPYRVRVYGADQVLLNEVSGTLDLPPAARMPVFIPGVVVGTHPAVVAFLEIDPASPRWFRLASDPRIIPAVSNTTLSADKGTPRIVATVTNSTITPLANLPVIVVVRDAAGNVIGASSTLIPSLPELGQASALFTWNGAFIATPTSIEVIPVPGLP